VGAGWHNSGCVVGPHWVAPTAKQAALSSPTARRRRRGISSDWVGGFFFFFSPEADTHPPKAGKTPKIGAKKWPENVGRPKKAKRWRIDLKTPSSLRLMEITGRKRDLGLGKSSWLARRLSPETPDFSESKEKPWAPTPLWSQAALGPSSQSSPKNTPRMPKRMRMKMRNNGCACEF